MTHPLGHLKKDFLCVFSGSVWAWPGWRHQWCESLSPVSQHFCLTQEGAELWGLAEEAEEEEERGERKSQQKAYSVGFPMLKSVSGIPVNSRSFPWMVNWVHDSSILSRGLWTCLSILLRLSLVIMVVFLCNRNQRYGETSNSELFRRKSSKSRFSKIELPSVLLHH